MMDDTVANRIRAMRVNKNFTQEYVADKLGYKSSQGYGDIERGKNAITIDKLQQLADFFECNVIDLIPEKPIKQNVVNEPQEKYGLSRIERELEDLKTQVKTLMDLLRPKINLG